MTLCKTFARGVSLTSEALARWSPHEHPVNIIERGNLSASHSEENIFIFKNQEGVDYLKTIRGCVLLYPSILHAANLNLVR